jgi:hypothetical protein
MSTTERGPARWRAGLLLLGLCLAGLGPSGPIQPRPAAGQAAAPEQAAVPLKPFHQVHVRELNVACTACHETAPDAKPGHELAFSVRPGHAACEGCHGDEFAKDKLTAERAATPYCQTCHTGQGRAVGRFPSGRLNLARFSHAAHIDPHPRMGKRLGIRQDCLFCHKVEATAVKPARPGHAECAACHAGSSPARPVLAKEEAVEPCLACHSLERIDRTIQMRQTAGAGGPAGGGTRPKGASAAHAYRDIRPFNHGSHLARRDGAPIDCLACHVPVAQKRDPEPPSRLPTMRECAACHDNASFVRAEHLIKHCHTCHTVVRADLRPQASDPVSRALAHTELFRANHAAQARDPDAQCAVCHTRFVNVGQNACAGCHSAMRPRSHLGVRFKEEVHGRLAGMDRSACASCHTGDFCIRCHSVAPRSHLPLQTFAGRLGGAHREPAILNLRSCFVCHTFEDTCARCHRRELRR